MRILHKKASGLPDSILNSTFGEAMSRRELHTLNQMTTPVRVCRRFPLLRQGTVGRECLLVVDGEVKIERDGVAVATLGDGALVGEMSLLTGELRNASAKTASIVSLLAMNRQEFNRVLETCPGFAQQVVEVATQRRARASPIHIASRRCGPVVNRSAS